jgi:hypothetical protein
MSKKDINKLYKLKELSKDINIPIFKNNNILENTETIKKEVALAKKNNLTIFKRQIKNNQPINYSGLYRVYKRKIKILTKIEKDSEYLNKKIPNYTIKLKKYKMRDIYEIYSN